MLAGIPIPAATQVVSAPGLGRSPTGGRQVSISASSVAKRGARQCLSPSISTRCWTARGSDDRLRRLSFRGGLHPELGALTYLAAGVAPQAREYALRRTGKLIAGSGSILWYSLRSLRTMNGHAWAVTEASAESPQDHPCIHGK